jgi:hypothetical protein
LWACACCRRFGDLLTDKRNWDAIEVAERKADGLADEDEVQKARKAAAQVPQIREKLHGTPAEWAASACRWLLHPSAGEWTTATTRASHAISMVESRATTRDAEDRLQFELLRDVFGNPFRPVSFDPEWRTAVVVSLARNMYDSRDFSTLPILSDALQDAGCANEDILNHCRSWGLHVKGCWVVDLALGMK